jgi:hypothetical protein
MGLSVENAQTFFIARRRESNLVLLDDIDGIPMLVEQSVVLLRAEYVLGEDASDDRLFQLSSTLDSPQQMLLAMTAGLEGPQSRSAVAYRGSVAFIQVWKDGSHNYIERLDGVRYTAVTTQSAVAWATDLRLHKPAYFLTGTPANANLWSIERADLDFSKIKDDVLRQEAEKHWTDLQQLIKRHSYYGAITAAKDLMETLLEYEFKRHSSRSMDGLLKKLSNTLSANPSSLTLPFSQLDVHLMQKLRLLHQRTHPGRVATVGRSVRPELALSVAEDAIEIVTSIGLSK